MKSDSDIQRDVLAELKWEPSVNAADIGVEVKDGVVTLAGHVTSFAEKWNAERAAQRVSGVKALAIEMDVNLPGSSKRSDADLARSAAEVLGWMADLPSGAIHVMVENGWITLSGEVQWEFQRQDAVASVRYLLGVKGVGDSIAIKPKGPSTAVKKDIEAALKRRHGAHAHKLAISVHGSEVTLSGSVDSWAERELARHSAWGTPGVSNVIDHITVAS